MPTPTPTPPNLVASVITRRVTASQADADVRIRRIVSAWQSIERNSYKPVVYHGKMRQGDAQDLERHRQKCLAHELQRRRALGVFDRAA